MGQELVATFPRAGWSIVPSVLFAIRKINDRMYATKDEGNETRESFFSCRIFEPRVGRYSVRSGQARTSTRRCTHRYESRHNHGTRHGP